MTVSGILSLVESKVGNFLFNILIMLKNNSKSFYELHLLASLVFN